MRGPLLQRPEPGQQFGTRVCQAVAGLGAFRHARLGAFPQPVGQHAGGDVAAALLQLPESGHGSPWSSQSSRSVHRRPSRSSRSSSAMTGLPLREPRTARPGSGDGRDIVIPPLFSPKQQC